MYSGKNRWLVALMGLVALTLLATVAGCQSATPTPATPATSAPPATTREPAGLSGNLSLAGSTSVQPLAETLAEAFMAQNPNVTIDVQGGGSSVGVTSAGQGTVDIGMASRAIKDSEMQEFPSLQTFTIAYDGIAIVVHPDVQLGNLTIEQVRGIFGGQITNFRQVGGPDAPIIVVSREEGSGTRAAFQDMVMKTGDTEVPITASAILQQSNGAVRTTVAETPNSIAYLSFGFLDTSVRAVPVEGVEPTMENVLNRSYPIFRPFNLLTNGAPNPLAQAFIDFILSAEGQQIVAEHYIPLGEASSTGTTGLSGELSLAGSTSVQPLAETLAEAFMAQNPDVTIDVQGGGSSVGVTSAGQGTVDIGMASRAIKSSEMQEFPNLQVFPIAYDGIAIVVHPDVQLENLTLEQVRGIFGGQITNFRQVGGPDAPIIVVSREEGSGTRAAFQDMVMKTGDTEVPITASAILQQSNGAVRTTVAETPNSIAYLSFGFLDESVRGVSVEGVAPTMENVLNRSYPIFRPFNLLTNGAPNPLAQAFIGFVLSTEGQQIVAEHYIPVGQ